MFLQVKRRKEELSQYESVDCGKPIVEAEADMVSCGFARPAVLYYGKKAM